MNSSNEVFIPTLPEDLPRLVMEDGTVCLMDSNTLWIPTGMSADLSSHPTPSAEQRAVEPTTLILSTQYDQVEPIYDCCPPLVLDPSCSTDIQQHWMLPDVSTETPAQQFVREFNQGSYFVSDLQQMHPETFSCVLPELDHPPQDLCQEPFPVMWSTPLYVLPGMSQTLPESIFEPRLCQPTQHRNSVPDNILLFDPQPPGSRLAAGEHKLFAVGTPESPVINAVPEPLYIQRLVENRVGQTMSDKPATNGEYLYLTKTVQSQNTNSVASKRKLSDGTDCEILGGKLAKVEEYDVVDEMELLRAVDSLSAVSWDSPAV